ncbi:MAG: AtpZ/AtpI family protein [Planctomycetes bacterium]|nr:AtpZ/AtpI family protein [Planctomycetota bacterium]MBL7008955.1 AtpZ/AtpI family protein [Planctomycetota bacterium]
MADRPPDLRADYARYSTIGVEFTAIVGILGWLGHLLDGLILGPQGFPVFLLAGIFGGLIGGILRMNRQLAGRRKNAGDTEAPDHDEPE